MMMTLPPKNIDIIHIEIIFNFEESLFPFRISKIKATIAPGISHLWVKCERNVMVGISTLKIKIFANKKGDTVILLVIL